MTALRILNLIAWVGVLSYTLPAVVSILRGKARQSDPARLIYALFAVMVIGFNLRTIAIPESGTTQTALLVLSVVIAAFTIRTARAYGRGSHVDA